MSRKGAKTREPEAKCEFGQWVVECLDILGMREYELATASGLSEATVCRHIRGTYSPKNMDTVFKYWRVLGSVSVWTIGDVLDMIHRDVNKKESRDV